MLIRFCLYGFLKNQRYFEPFLYLAFLDKGLTFLQIGILVAVEGVTMNLLEVPSGALADLMGRRKTMILSFVAYLFSFLAFGMAQSFGALCGAMVLFGIGESFRTGSHKALIFAWLKREGRSHEKTRVYGLTRSFSKYGSALSAMIAAVLVFSSSDYQSIFFWSMVPCGLSILNLLTYPGDIDPPVEGLTSPRTVIAHLAASLKEVVRRPGLRRTVFESMTFHGLFRATKDYVQPVLLLAAVAWFGGAAADLADERQAALLVGPVYSILFLGSALASRHAHAFAGWCGGERAAVRTLWIAFACLFALLTAASAYEILDAVILGFVLLHVLQNLWRPILTSRIYDELDDRAGATVLSIESQGQRVTAVVFAPLFGYLVDTSHSFWPAAGIATLVAVWFALRPRATSPAAAGSEATV